MTDAMVAALRRLPGLHGLRDRLPVRRAVRRLIEATRAQVERQHDRPPGRPGAARRRSSRCSPTRGGCGCCAGRCAPTRRPGCSGAAPQRAARAAGADAGGDGGAGAAVTRREPAARAGAGPRAAAGGRRHAHRLRAGRVLPRRQRGDRAGARGGGLRRRHPARRRAAAARCRCTTAARPRRSVRPRASIDTFEAAGVDAVVVNAAGCGSSMKEYADLLADDPAYAERAAGFAAQGARRHRAARRARPGRAAAPAAGDRRLPRRLPPRRTPRASAPSRGRCCADIPGLELREIAEAELCCGSAGIWNILNPEPARRARRPQGRATSLATGAELLVTANPGCLMQVGLRARAPQGDRIGMAHTVEVLDASIRGLLAGALVGARAGATALSRAR